MKRDNAVGNHEQQATTLPGTIDWSVLEGMRIFQQPGKPDLRRQLMSLYLGSSPELMEKVRNAVASGDGQALMQAAHSLKSSSMSLGATLFSELCASLEQLGRANTLTEAPLFLVRAETEFDAIRAAFSRALEEDAP